LPGRNPGVFSLVGDYWDWLDMADDKNRNDRDKRMRKHKLRKSELEADVAYFEARLSMLDEEAETNYQQAQKKIYKLLGDALSESLSELEEKKVVEDGSSGAGGKK